MDTGFQADARAGATVTLSVASRLRRRCIAMTRDADLVARLRAGLPGGWEMPVVLALGELGGFEEIVQYRFLLLDLDEVDAWSAVDVLLELRSDLMLNVPVFCFGGSSRARDEARLARADRCFDRDAICGEVPVFCDQFGWGG